MNVPFQTGITNTDIALPVCLEPRYEQMLSSVELSAIFAVRDEPEWVDDAPMVLRSRGRARVRITGVRRMTFSSVGDEFIDED